MEYNITVLTFTLHDGDDRNDNKIDKNISKKHHIAIPTIR